MNYLHLFFGLILTVLILSACGGSESTDTLAPTSETNGTESVFDPMVTTIDKAKGVEGLSADRIDELDKEIENAQ